RRRFLVAAAKRLAAGEVRHPSDEPAEQIPVWHPRNVALLFAAAMAGARTGYDAAGRAPGSDGCFHARSWSSSQRLTGRPPPYPVSDPFAPITRWHGTMMGIGLRPLAAPTARLASGRPIDRAMSP